jgi:gliding motility-associated-like protein
LLQLLSTNPSVTYEELTSGGPVGSCVNVNTANSFEVVYLNAIQGAIVSQGNLTGSFKVSGGLSEYDNTSNYTINIVLKSNPAKKGTVTSGAAKHNGTVTFTVPENGVYLISVKDGKSCDAQFDMITSTNVDFIVKNDTVCSDKKGTLKIIPSGGIGPYSYTYEKSPPPNPVNGKFNTDMPITGLEGGDYLITVFDATGKASDTKVGSVVKANPFLAVTTSENKPTCPNSFDGNVTANAVGGFPPYYYSWSSGQMGSNQKNITGLGSGKFSVTVTDNIGCTSDASTNLTGNAPMMITLNKSANATCYGAKDGLVSFELTGGVPDPITGSYSKFQYSWNNGKNTYEDKDRIAGYFPNVDPATYQITVTDSKGCIFTDSIVIGAKRTLEVQKSLTDAKCFGQKNGAITLQITQKGQGSTSAGGFDFAWNPSPSALPPVNTAFTTSLSSVGNGTYKVTITDKTFGCIIQDSVQIKQPKSALSATIAAKSDPTCAGNSANGNINVSASGGTSPYSYKWSDGVTITPNPTNLVAGTYTITVTDANDCSKIVTATLKDPLGPKVTNIDISSVNCSTDKNGSIKLTVTPANAADVLTYKWSNGSQGVDFKEISNLAPDTYSVTITDNKGCAIIRDSIVVKSPPKLELVGSAAVTKPSCSSSSDGKMEFTVKGGTPAYSYKWRNQLDSTMSQGGFNGPTIMVTGLKVGIYNVTITDQNNCPGLEIALIDVAIPPTITLTKSLDKGIDCFNTKACNGKATVTVTSGNSPTGSYNFAWQDGSFGAGKAGDPISATKLCFGWQRVTVSDTRCDYVDSIYVDSPTKVDTSNVQITNPTCFSSEDGSISLSGKGGVGPYSYSWDNNSFSTNSTITDVKAGTYLLKIKDSKDCEYSTSITIVEPPKLMVVVETVDSLKCAGSNDGRITVNATGGNDAVSGQPKYTFTWKDNVSTSSIADKLQAGEYYVIVTDSKGCVAKDTAIVGQPDEILFMLDTIAEPLCNGYTTEVKLKSASGGSGSQLSNYALVINDQELPRGTSAQLGGGKHRINVSDPDGCIAVKDLEIEIQEPPRVRVYLGQDVELELGDSYEINAAIESVVKVVKYNWTTSVGATPLTFSDSCKERCGLIVRPLVDGSYTLQVEDTLGCIGADTLNITIDRNRNVFIPNIFSPNVDGTNDFFEVFADAQSVEQINYLRVYDRWGTQVFESPSFSPQASRLNGNRWNGYYKDQEANIGVYVYVCEVKFIDGLVIVFRGDVMLAR